MALPQDVKGTTKQWIFGPLSIYVFFVGDEHLPEAWGILYNYKDFVTNHDFMRCKKVV